MEILGIKSERVQIELASDGRWGPNKIDLLTGPNGSGKTEVLTMLVEAFRNAKRESKKGSIAWENHGRSFNTLTESLEHNGPARVIAQTFSPFTRFPQPADSNISLTSIYSEGKQLDLRYICIGLHRSTRLVGSSLSKRTLEQAIYRFSETPESAKTTLEVMRNLNFKDSFDLKYEARPLLREILEYGARGVTSFLDDLESRRSPYSRARTGLSSEIRRTNRGHLAELLSEALTILGSQLREARVFHQHFGSHEYRNSYDYATLQSLALLRRLDLLTLKSCELTDLSGTKFDVANASSGQQQMLCSVIGLAAALQSNSLILIDEPELSLHPRWQQLYLDNLRAALEPFEDCHVLIATHSPLIVQRGQSLGAGVVQIGQESTSLSLSSRSSVEGTLLDVFDTPVTGSAHLANQIFSAITNAEMGGEDAIQSSLAELGRLKDLYSDPQLGDTKTLQLIEEAVDLLHTNEEDNA